MTFHVGQKVVCVDDKVRTGYVWHDSDGVKNSSVYTVREVGITHLGEPGIKVVESTHRGWHLLERLEDAFYRADRFRPIIERKTSIEVFEQIRRNVEKKIVERV